MGVPKAVQQTSECDSRIIGQTDLGRGFRSREERDMTPSYALGGTKMPRPKQNNQLKGVDSLKFNDKNVTVWIRLPNVWMIISFLKCFQKIHDADNTK